MTAPLPPHRILVLLTADRLPDDVVIALQPEERETWSEHDLEDTARLYVDAPVRVQHAAAAAGG